MDGLNAVIYARFSPGKTQKEISIEGQIRECTDYAERNNINIIGTYADRRKSGRNDSREDFRRLMRDVEAGEFDIVLVWKFDRFFRNREESALYRKHLRKYGCKLVSVKEFVDAGPSGIIMEGMYETFAEWYSARLAEDVSRGMYDTAKKGQVTGPLPLGYKTGPDKRPQIVPGEAAIVREAFEMYNDGHSIKDICSSFNRKGYRTKRGVEFRISTFDKLFGNVKYIGIYKYGDKLEMKGGWPAIIDEELFFSVQRKLSANIISRARGKATTEYFLSTKLFCGHCGKMMCGESALRKGVRHYYYACSTRRRQHTCKKKNVRKDDIEEAVLRAALGVLTDENIAYIAAGVESAVAAENKNFSLLADLKGQLADVEGNISNISKAIMQGIITETTKTLLEQAEADRASLKKRIAQEQIVSKLAVTADGVAAWLESFRHGDCNAPEFKRQVFGMLINAVYLYDDHFRILFNVDKMGATEVPFSAIEKMEKESNGTSLCLDTISSGSPEKHL